MPTATPIPAESRAGGRPQGCLRGIAVAPGTAIRRWLGLHSVRSRYLLLAGIFAALAAATAMVAENGVRDATDLSVGNARARAAIRGGLRDLVDEMWAAESHLQHFLLVPEAAHQTRVLGSIARARTRAAWVVAELARRSGDVAAHSAGTLDSDFAALERWVDEVMRIRVDVERLFPAARIQNEHMLPSNTAFYTAATLAMDEIAAEPDRADRHRIHLLFADARHDWAMMTSAFRLYIANRLGIFAEPEAGMRAQRENIALYSEAVGHLLANLEALGEAGRLGLQASESLARMQRARNTWLASFEEVESIYTSGEWRTDVPLLNNRVEPLFTRVWEGVRLLEARLDALAVGDVNSLTRTSSDLTRTIWLIALVGVALTAIGFVLFERTLRRPLARVAAALKAEAIGAPVVRMPHTQTVETRDLTAAFEAMRDQVRSRQSRLEAILDNAAEGIIMFGTDGIVETFNDSAQALFGHRESEVVGAPITTLLAPSLGEGEPGAYLPRFLAKELPGLSGREGEVTGLRSDGTKFPMSIKVTRLVIDGEEKHMCLVSDITERKAMVERLRHTAEHDGLTGLYNRTYFTQALAQALARARRDATCSSLLYIDLDNFKYVNDTAGHAAGDRLLAEVANLLTARARESDLVARFGGDEFTILLHGTDPGEARGVAEAFRRRFADFTFRCEGVEVDVGCSIGVAPICPDTDDAAQALSHADFACHLAKRAGRNQVRVFEEADRQDVETMSVDMGWSRRIKSAIERDRFVLATQPIVCTSSRETVSHEVLIRMLDERNGLCLPGGFLPAAERFGLARDIDRWVLARAIDTLAELRRVDPGVCFSVNLSAQSLSDPDLCDEIAARLAASELDPGALVFEVTETTAICDMAVAGRFLSRLQGIGCRTALDDFGTGMSSFAYLRDLPVDIVKIDGRFVRNLATSAVDQAMVKAMNEIVHGLGKRSVAEFVENEESLALLAQFGVDYAQGFHVGRPVIQAPAARKALHLVAG